MLIRPLFNRYQKQILKFANTDLGKWYLGVENKDFEVVGVYPDGIHQRIGGDEYIATFYSRSPYLRKLDLALRSMAIIEENGYKLKEFANQAHLIIPNYQALIAPVKTLPGIMLVSKTIYPDAHPETTTVDGSIGLNEGSTTWSTVRDSATGTVDDTLTIDSNIAHCMTHFNHSGGDPDKYSIGRGYFLFDTSSISSIANVTSVSLSIYNRQTDLPGYALTYCIVTSNPTSNTALVSADFATSHFGTSVLASKSWATLDGAESQYSVHTLATTAVVKNGITKLGTRTDKDINNSAPASGSNAMSFTYFSDYGSNKPYLSVVYTQATVSAFML